MTGIREIGSEFWDVPITDARNDLFDLDTKWYLSGRSALRAVIKSIRGAKSVSMPAWCCESMIIPFVQAGWEINFYPVYPKDGTLVFDMERCEESEVLFLMITLALKPQSASILATPL